MRIQHATLDDIASADLLLREYYEAIGVTKRDTPEELRACLSREASAFWLAYMEDKLAGCVALRSLPSLERAGECKRLYVRPEFRNQGLAAALLDTLEQYASVNGLNWVYLDSKDDLQDAIRMYLRRGYEPCDRFNNNPQATIFFRKQLHGPEPASR